MQVIKELERLRVALLGAINRFCFRLPRAMPWSWLGQVAFPGRIWSDAAKYVYVVLVAGSFPGCLDPSVFTQNNKSCSIFREWPAPVFGNDGGNRARLQVLPDPVAGDHDSSPENPFWPRC